MIALLTWPFAFLGRLLRGLTLPLLEGTGGVLATLAIPTLRGLCGVCFIVAAVALASDLGTAPSGGARAFTPTPALRHWQSVAPQSLEGTRSFLIKRTRPWVWDAVSAPLRMPTFAFFSLLGLVFGYLGRRRTGVNIFAN